MLDLVSIIGTIIHSSYFLLATLLGALVVKIYLVTLLIPKDIRNTSIKITWLLLLAVLLGSIVGDVSWISKLLRQLFFPWIPYYFHVTILRFAWAALIVQYQSLSLFIESLTKKKYELHWIHKIMISISSSFMLYFIYEALFDSSFTSEYERNKSFALLGAPEAPFEAHVMYYTGIYLLPVIILPTLFFTFKNIKNENLPKILKKQLTILIKYLLCPFLFAECIIAYNQITVHSYIAPLLSISTILISYSIYYCIRKVLGLRFLNFHKQLQARQRINFINNFKDILDQLSKVTSVEELTQITQTFFKEAFNIPVKKTMLFVRHSPAKEHTQEIAERVNSTEEFIENFMLHHPNTICELIKKTKLLLYDELVFSNFYEEHPSYATLINFLEKINADIFLPIFQKQKIIAYIVIEFNARPNQLYNSADRDEMIIMANYIGTILNLLQHRNLDLLIQQEKELKEELYLTHQEVQQYKESIHSFLKNDSTKEIGIIFYKNGQFTFGNKAAQKLINVDLNTQEGHPLTKEITDLADEVETYKVPKTILVNADEKLVVVGMINLEKNNVIITVYRPEIADIIKKQIDLLKDLSNWNYILYLETTKIGNLINQAIPSSGEKLLNFKIQFLKTALSKQAALIDAHEDDVLELIELLHAISLKNMLYIIDLKEPVKTADYAIKLFGINPLIGNPNKEQPLLEKLNNTGTLCIKNIHFLDLETQNYLADYLKTGFFRTYKSDQKTSSNVRIICSTDQDLLHQSQKGTFSLQFFNELKKNFLIMPSLVTLPDSEFYQLIDELTVQILKTDEFKSILELTGREKIKLLSPRPESLSEIKKRIKNILIAKSKKHNLYEDIQIEPAILDTSSAIVQASRLGKQALKDRRLMILLWNKFKNQNKIATFLGVNRSSVYRRCREFNLE